jgi:hypothetical protein
MGMMPPKIEVQTISSGIQSKRMMFVKCCILKLTEWKKSVLLFLEAAGVSKPISTLLMAHCWRRSKHSLGLVYVTDDTYHILTYVLFLQFFQAYVRILYMWAW